MKQLFSWADETINNEQCRWKKQNFIWSVVIETVRCVYWNLLGEELIPMVEKSMYKSTKNRIRHVNINCSSINLCRKTTNRASIIGQKSILVGFIYWTFNPLYLVNRSRWLTGSSDRAELDCLCSGRLLPECWTLSFSLRERLYKIKQNWINPTVIWRCTDRE